MSRFSDIVGQEQLREHLENAIRLNKISHAYIINGERNAGKEFIAKTFAMALQCEKRSVSDPQETEPCGECHSCRQAASGNHPDIIRLTHEKPNTSVLTTSVPRLIMILLLSLTADPKRYTL